MRGTYEVYVYDEASDEEYEVCIDYVISGHYEPAYTSGPIDKCYPAQYPDHDYDSITVEAYGRKYHLQLEEVCALAGVTPEYIETAICELAAEAEQDAAEYAADARADSRRDEWIDRDESHWND